MTPSTKATTLRRLADEGYPVPAFVVIPGTVRRGFLDALSGPPTANAIRGATWPPTCADTVRALVAQLPADAARVAVRSSMAGEDGARFSFAGQLETFLDVPNEPGSAAVLAAVQACWAAAFGPRVTAYRQRHGLAAASGHLPELDMEVIVQVMVDAACAGVVFTADPVTGGREEMVVSVAPGLGEDLVQGAVAGETLRVDRASGTAGAVSRILSAPQIRALCDMSGQVEALLGDPQDIEFAIAKDGRLALLQARPITTPVAPAMDEPAERMLWDNANITESYAGVTSPLTFTVIRRAYAGVYRQFLALMGVREPDETVLQNLLGYYHGQVYYQLDNWYAALALLPAFEHNRAFMEQMLGVKQSAGADSAPRPGRRLRLVAWAWRMLRLHRRRAALTAAFTHDVNGYLAQLAARDLAALTPRQLHGEFLGLETHVLGNWQAPIITDFFAMIFYGTLQRLTTRWLPDAPRLHNDLLAGDGAIESLAPVRRIGELAAAVRADPALAAVFDLPAGETWLRLGTDERFAAFRADVDDYLQRYGDRCMDELKLEEPNLRDDPARLVELVAAAARMPPVQATDAGAARRSTAEARVRQLTWWRRGLYGWVLGHTRRAVRDRENMRFVRSRVFGQLRRLFNAVGTRYAAAGLIDDPAHLYYLTLDEVWNLVTGTATTLDVRGLVALRRREADAFRRESWPERFQTVGLPYLAPPRPLLRPAAGRSGDAAPGTTPDLTGTGCCSGRVIGRARVVASADGVLDVAGDVLVAERTDPGWVFLFPSATALLVERGSPLSHSAIVARELGLPTIVNIPNLTRLVHTGDVVELDGGSGAVWLRQRAAGG